MSSKPPLAPTNNTKGEDPKLSARPDQKVETSRASARDANETKTSARGNENEVNSARASGRLSGRDELLDKTLAMSARGPEGNMDTFRSTMSTARVHTALAALTAEKNALEARLQKIDASLESEKRKGVSKLRALRK